MMSNMALSTQVERGGEKEGDKGPSKVVDERVRMKHVVFRFMAESVTRVHDQTIGRSQHEQTWPTIDPASDDEKGRTQEGDKSGKKKIQGAGNGIVVGFHDDELG
jgi:hypothetical protein